MSRRLLKVVIAAVAVSAVPLVAGLAGAAPSLSSNASTSTAASTNAAASTSFVKRSGPRLQVNGTTFRFAGTNNYYLFYKSTAMVDAVLDKAKAAGFTVLRTWASQEVQDPDGSNSVSPPGAGVWFQYWDAAAGKPAIKTGPDGIDRLDYVVWKAKQDGIRLVLPLVNNWNNFGGMDQYVKWAGGSYHDDFYTNATIRGWYRDWINYLLNRTNTLTGLKYKDDPTIMTWELGNEPRCVSAGVYPRSSTCTTATLTTWADEMSTYIKSIDPNHLVSVGDEGFYAKDTSSSDWTINGGDGVDTIAFAKLKNIDVMSYHLYPGGWGKDAAWGDKWITDHQADARKVGKPVMLGEFGWPDKATRNTVYRKWTSLITPSSSGGVGALNWLLADVQDDGTLYPDYDGFTMYCPGAICTAMSNFSKEIRGVADHFPPVADNDTATAAFNTPAAVNVTANDIAYNGATINTRTVDLDPATAGRQATVTTANGTFAAAADGTVTFTPVDGYSGKPSVSYTVADSSARVSNVATLTVVIKPDPNAALRLFSFEDGVEGWAPASWDPRGSVAQTTDFATDGTHGLEVASDDNWYGLQLAETTDLSAKTTLKFDVKTADAGTSNSIAIQTGDAWSWCSGPWVWTNASSTSTYSVDLASLTCDSGTLDLTKVHALYIYFNKGTFDLDNIRAE